MNGASDQPSKKVKLPPMQRGPNAYNLFCSEIFQTGKVEIVVTSKRSLSHEAVKLQI